MASKKNITIKQYNGTDYDTLYPKTNDNQVLLTDSSKELLGITKENASVSDALSSVASQDISWKVGDIMTTVRNNLGEKWLLCNGAGVTQTVYPELYNLLPEKDLSALANYDVVTRTQPPYVIASISTPNGIPIICGSTSNSYPYTYSFYTANSITDVSWTRRFSSSYSSNPFNNWVYWNNQYISCSYSSTSGTGASWNGVLYLIHCDDILTQSTPPTQVILHSESGDPQSNLIHGDRLFVNNDQLYVCSPVIPTYATYKYGFYTVNKSYGAGQISTNVACSDVTNGRIFGIKWTQNPTTLTIVELVNNVWEDVQVLDNISLNSGNMKSFYYNDEYYICMSISTIAYLYKRKSDDSWELVGQKDIGSNISIRQYYDGHIYFGSSNSSVNINCVSVDNFTTESIVSIPVKGIITEDGYIFSGGDGGSTWHIKDGRILPTITQSGAYTYIKAK